jgi:hypothetical protein
MRSRHLFVVTLALLALVAGAAPAGGGPTYRTVTYEVRTSGTVHADVADFAAAVGQILSDARGWTLGGSVRFRRVSSGADLVVVLASPTAIGAAHPVCDPGFSCRVGNKVLLNDGNWRGATRAWREAGGTLADYRRYVLHHEMGHWWGFGHVGCPRPGAAAPIMLQQSVSLQGCRPTAWPLAAERNRLASQLGVEVHPWVFHDVLFGFVHREAIHAVAAAGIAGGYRDGTFRPDQPVTRAQLATFLDHALELPPARDPRPFRDVEPGSAHGPAIARAAEAGIIRGFADGTFRPTARVARGHTASMIARGYGYEATGPPPFTDVAPGHTHAQGIAALAEAGIASGYGDGTYRPARSVSRGEVASFLARAERLDR